jgi:methyl-accepting chemotaxis protein
MTEQNTNPRGRFLSLRLKILLGFTVLFTIVLSISYYWFYQYTNARVFQTITTNLENTLDGTIKGMDKEKFVRLYEGESADNPMCPPALGAEENGYYPEDNPLYMEHVNWLYAAQQLEPETRIYTYIKGIETGEVIGIGSTGYFREPRGGFKFCERYTSTNTRIYDGLTERVNRWEPYTDRFGTWITTYAPIIDDSGQVIGAIGVDISAAYVREVRDGILRSGTIAFLFSFIFVLFIVYWFSNLVTSPIVGLANVAKEIGEGNYDPEWREENKKNNFQDEIDTLTTVFKSMVAKVAQREENLRARVHQLEIMIDRSKLEKQVSEIVESDFFQDLQSKVTSMRNRFKKEE